MEYFVFLLIGLTSVEERFNGGVCHQLQNYLDIEERLYGTANGLWEQCNKVEDCSKFQYSFYKSYWLCDSDPSTDDEGEE